MTKSSCAVCNTWESPDEPAEELAGYQATWHVYEEHPDVWQWLFGDTAPRDPDVRIPEVRNMVQSRRHWKLNL